MLGSPSTIVLALMPGSLPSFEQVTMEEEAQKRRERAHLERFREARPDFPTGPVHQGDPNQGEPDFIVENAGRIIGIEHTDFHWDEKSQGGSPLRGQETYQQQVVASAARLYESRGLPFLNVLLSWSPHYTLAKPRLQQLAEELDDLVARFAPAPNQWVEIEFPEPGWDLLPDEVTRMRIYRFDCLTRHQWDFVRTDFSRWISTDRLQDVISKKNSKIAAYRAKCGEVWLLIVLDGRYPSSFGELTAAAVDHEFDAGFDRLFFLLNFNGECVELKRRRG